MKNNSNSPIGPNSDLEPAVNDEYQKLAEGLKSKKEILFGKFAHAALGSIPWVGGFMSAYASYKEDADQQETDDIQRRWLEEHQEKIRRLGSTIVEMMERFEALGEELDERLQSEEYLALVRRGFRDWDQADTEEKQRLIQQLLTNAGATSLCPDDLIRLFLDWIGRFHEAHFMVIREIYRQPGCTRRQIWESIHGDIPRENSSEADLFKLLIYDLSTGHVIRQHRPVDAYGNFIKKSTRRKSTGGRTMKSAFDDIEPYELTELGGKFIHYTMNEVVSRISEDETGQSS